MGASSVAGSGSAAVTWTASTGTTVPEGYYVVRTRTSDSTVAAACGTSPTSLTAAAAVSCTDSFVPVGTYTYAVTAVYRGWTARSASSASVVVVVADHLAFTAQPGSGTGGTALVSQPAVTVQDFFGGTVTSYAGSVTLALTTPGGATLSCTANPKTVVVGVATFAGCKVDRVGTYTLDRDRRVLGLRGQQQLHGQCRRRQPAGLQHATGLRHRGDGPGRRNPPRPSRTPAATPSPPTPAPCPSR